MKKILPLLMILFSLTGCFKKDSLDGITIYTTVYPIEYIVGELYGGHSTIHSIYPDEVDIKKYQLTNKQIKDYSKANMYIFNGLSTEKDYVSAMFKHNKKLMIIDAATTMEFTYSNEELWLDPSNFLMMSLNIKNGLTEYIENHYLKNQIEENYEKLKIKVSNLDAKLKLLSENATDSTIIVDNNVFKFLEKYGFNVISLEEGATLTDKIISDAKAAIQAKKVSYIFTTTDTPNNTVNKLVNEYSVDILRLNTLSNLTDDQRGNQDDYMTLLNENMEQLKNELY